MRITSLSILLLCVISCSHRSKKDQTQPNASPTADQNIPDGYEEVADLSNKKKLTIASKKDGKGVQIIISPPEKNILSHFEYGKKESWIELVKSIHKLADKFKLNICGFDFKGSPAEKSFTMSASDTGDYCSGANIRLDQANDTNRITQYKPYIDNDKSDSSFHEVNKKPGALLTETHSVSFYSSSGNRLVIPKKTYPTVYHFSKHASNEEIAGLWGQISSIVAMKDFAKKFKRFAIHTGSRYAQSVNHFHFRIEK